MVYVGKVATLDLGESAFSRRPVAVDIAQRLPATLAAHLNTHCRTQLTRA